MTTQEITDAVNATALLWAPWLTKLMTNIFNNGVLTRLGIQDDKNRIVRAACWLMAAICIGGARWFAGQPLIPADRGELLRAASDLGAIFAAAYAAKGMHDTAPGAPKAVGG